MNKMLSGQKNHYLLWYTVKKQRNSTICVEKTPYIGNSFGLVISKNDLSFDF